MEAKKAQDFSLQVIQEGTNISLEGKVASPTDREWMERVARETSGVSNVKNLLVLRPAPSDDEIVKNVNAAIRNSGEINPSDITVSSNSGIVLLRGNLPNHRSVDLVLAQAMLVSGVKNVECKILVLCVPYPHS